MRRHVAWLLTLLLLPIASPAAPGPTPVEWRWPDGDGGYTLAYDVARAAAGPAHLRLLVTQGDATGTRDLGTRDLPAGTTRVELPFLPAEGEGAYSVALEVDGAAGEPLRFDVATAATATSVTWVVPDEPTRLALVNDTVNADGKLKSPGDALVTRARLDDANGMADVRAVEWFVLRGASLVDAGSFPPPGEPNATNATLEHRYARTPLAAGDYSLVLRANGAEARRTFAIRDVAPTLAALRVENVTLDEDRVVETTAALADRNGWNATPNLDARVYRASTRLPIAVTLGAPLVDGEAARVPLRFTLPQATAPGTLRLSLYVDGALVGSAPFDALAPPRLVNVTARPAGDAVTLALDLSAPGVVDLRVESGDAVTRTTRALPLGASETTLDAPGHAPLARWNVTLRAREGGPALAYAEGEWTRAVPTLALEPLRAGRWRVAADGWDLAGATVNATLARWDGATLTAPATLEGDRLALDVRGLEPGRYALALDVRLSNGTRAAASATFDLAPWLHVALGEANVTGREARVPLRNEGAPIRGLVVEVDGLAAAPVLESGGARHAGTPRGARHAFDVPLATGEDATLVLQLPDGPLPSGAHVARVRVLARGGSA